MVDNQRTRGLADLITYLRAGDTVQIASMELLGHDTRDLCKVVAGLTNKGAVVAYVNDNITVDKHGSSPLDFLMLGILAAFAEFERRRIRERQAEGIAIAKAKGKYEQKPKLTSRDIEQAQVMVDTGIPKTQVAATFEASR